MSRSLEEMLKDQWPDFHMTKDQLLHPTQDLVLRFYTRFVTEFENKISTALTWFNDNLRSDLDQEQYIFLKMRKINVLFEKVNINFLLGDICEPTFLRTKCIFTLCLHLLESSVRVFPYFQDHIAGVLKAKEDTNKLALDMEQLTQEINEAILQKVNLQDDEEALKEDIKNLEGKKENYLMRRSRKEIELQEKLKELERLKRGVEEKNASIGNLEAREKKLVEETFTEEEYLGLQKSHKNLILEKKSLQNENANVEETLALQNKTLNHFRDCLKAMPNNFNTDLVKKDIAMVRENECLESQKDRLLYDLDSHQSKFQRQEKLYNEAKEALRNTELEHEKVRLETQHKSECVTKAVRQHQEALDGDLRRCLAENERLKKAIAKLEHDSVRVKEHFTKEYKRICAAEREASETFAKQIARLNKVLLGRTVLPKGVSMKSS